MKAAPDLSAIAEQLAAIQRELGRGADVEAADRELVDRARAAGERLRRSRDIAAALPAMLAGMRKRGPRVLGPYQESEDKFRVVEIEANGKRNSSTFETAAAAERHIEIVLASMASADHTTSTALEEYKKHLAANGDKAESTAVVEWAILLFFPEPVALSSLTPAKCAALYEAIRTRPSERTGAPLAADTHRSALARVKSFLAWCIERRYFIGENPFAGVKGIGRLRPRGKSLGKSGTELRVREARAWYRKALELADKDERAVAALVALLLGMRANEITGRRVQDLDEDLEPGDLLWIPCSKTPAGRRTLEVPEVLRPFLLRCCAGKERDRYIFEASRPHQLGKRHGRDWVRHSVHLICDAAEVPRVTAHAMRGLLATLTAERGIAGHVIAATLGHEDERMTMHAYAAPGSKDTGVNRRGLVILSGGAAK